MYYGKVPNEVTHKTILLKEIKLYYSVFSLNVVTERNKNYYLVLLHFFLHEPQSLKSVWRRLILVLRKNNFWQLNFLNKLVQGFNEHLILQPLRGGKNLVTNAQPPITYRQQSKNKLWEVFSLLNATIIQFSILYIL